MLLKCYPINLGEEIVINRKVACYVKAQGPDSGEAGFSREPDLSQTNRLS